MTRHYHPGLPDECAVDEAPLTARDFVKVAGLALFLILAWAGIFGLIVAVALVLA